MTDTVEKIEPRDIYLRHTDKRGNTYTAQHRVWSAQRFINARREEAEKEGGEAKVEQITHEQYLKGKTHERT